MIIHVNSHGERAVVEDVKNSNNSFANLLITPVSNVNKVGLLYAAIPKRWDTLNSKNNNMSM